HGRQTASDHETELHRVVAFADIGAVGDLHTGLNREGKVFLRKQIVGEFLGSGPGSQEFGVIAGRNIVKFKDRKGRHEVGTVFLHQRKGLRGGKGTVFDRIAAGPTGGPNPARR